MHRLRVSLLPDSLSFSGIQTTASAAGGARAGWTCFSLFDKTPVNIASSDVALSNRSPRSPRNCNLSTLSRWPLSGKPAHLVPAVGLFVACKPLVVPTWVDPGKIYCESFVFNCFKLVTHFDDVENVLRLVGNRS